MDKIQETSYIIKRLNKYFMNEITNYEFIKNVCSHFDKFKSEEKN